MAFRKTVADPNSKQMVVYYHPHKKPASDRQAIWSQSQYYQVASIDPAIRNLGFRIERRHAGGRIEPLVFIKVDLDPKGKPKKKRPIAVAPPLEASAEATIFDRLNLFLDIYRPLLMECHMVLVERQPPIKPEIVRIEEHALTYCSLYLRDAPLLPLIVGVNPKLKGQMLGAPAHSSYQQLKQWSVEMAIALSQARQDQFSQDVLASVTKKDDLADTLCQIEAYFRYIGLATA
jgi:hypothetical protein